MTRPVTPDPASSRGPKLGVARSSGAELIRRTRARFGRTLLFAFVLTAGCNLGALVVPLFTMELYNVVLNTRNMNTLVWLSVVLALGIALYGTIEYMRSILHATMADRASRSLSLPSLLASGQRPEEGKQAQPAGQAVRDLSEIRAFAIGDAISTPLDLVWSPFLIFVLLTMHWAYAVFATICAVILLGLGLVSDVMTRRPLEEANNDTARSFAEIGVALRAAESVEGLGMLPALARRWRRSQNRMLEKLWQATRSAKAVGAASRASRILMSGGMVCLGLVLTIKGEASGGSIMATNMILARLLLPYSQLVISWREWVAAGAAWARLRSAIEQTRNLRGTIPLPCTRGHLVVDRLVYLPPGLERPVLRGISFEVRPGEVLGVIGPSGAGKSTIARLVVGAAEPSSGGIYLDGNSTWHWERGDFGRFVGYIPQIPILLEGSLADNIARLRDVDPHTVIATAKKAGIHKVVMALPHGYATPVGDAGFLLSGGQRQLLGLARALFGDPKLLVLDEPNSNLDEAGERVLLAAIDEARRRGTAVLMIAHRPSLVALADQLLVIQEGLVERFGDREGVLKALQSRAGENARSPAASSVTSSPTVLCLQ